MSFPTRHLLPVFALLFLASPRALGEEIVGLFADFQTSQGNFTASLDFERAPQTVANFVSLAEGTRPYLHAKTGAIVKDTPFYNGLIFHRVIADFMIQGGCPLGNGTGGPGYEIRDEVNNGLSHDRPYLLSMANSGPNTGGSQFFITVAPTTWLDNKHSLFGEVIEGKETIDAIENVATDSKNKPLQNVVIESVTIRRVGQAARDFDSHAQNLPVCSSSQGKLTQDKEGMVMWEFHPPLEGGHAITAYRSTNLATWSRLGEIFQDPGEESLTRAGLENPLGRAFFHLTQTWYPGAFRTGSTPADLVKRTLLVRVSNFKIDNVVYPTVEFRFLVDETGLTGNGVRSYGSFETPFKFDVADLVSGPYNFELILSTNLPYGYLRVAAGYDRELPLEYEGRQVLSNYTIFGWQELGTGPFHFTKP